VVTAPGRVRSAGGGCYLVMVLAMQAPARPASAPIAHRLSELSRPALPTSRVTITHTRPPRSSSNRANRVMPPSST
jgi:hypothetical protein